MWECKNFYCPGYDSKMLEVRTFLNEKKIEEWQLLFADKNYAEIIFKVPESDKTE